jgi:hypothetical protein
MACFLFRTYCSASTAQKGHERAQDPRGGQLAALVCVSARLDFSPASIFLQKEQIGLRLDFFAT